MRDDHQVKQLLRRIAIDDDEKAFSVFFDRYHAKLLRYANLWVRSMEEAEDVVSDVLINLLKNKKDHFLKENFIGYLFQSVKNKCLDHLRVEKKKNILFDNNYDEKDYFVFEQQTPISRLLHSELNQVLGQKIEELPPKRKLVFQLIKDEGMTYRQVAELMNISDRTVEVHLKLAIKDIKQTLEEYMDHSGYGEDEKRNLTKVVGLLMIFASVS